MKKKLEDFIEHIDSTMHNMVEEYERTDEQVIKDLTITLEGKSITFSIAWDTQETLVEMIRQELEHYE